MLGLEIENLESVPALLPDVPVPIAPPQGWDGKASERIAAIIAADLGAQAAVL